MWQIQQTSRETLERLLGPEAKWLKHRAHGHGGTILTPHHLPKSVSRETTLSQDSTDLKSLDRILTLFSARVAAQLREEGLAARTVQLKLRHGDFHTVTRRKTLPEPTNLDGEIYAAARELFDPAYREMRERDQGVRLLGVGTGNILVAGPADLFEPEKRTRARESHQRGGQGSREVWLRCDAAGEAAGTRKQGDGWGKARRKTHLVRPGRHSCGKACQHRAGATGSFVTLVAAQAGAARSPLLSFR